MQTIVIETIPHAKQRYETVGDYFTAHNWVRIGEGLTRQFRVSDMGNPDYEFLVALHELIESHLAQKRGISDAAIDAFDIAFEAARREGDTNEPGNDPRCPVYREHQFATQIEHMVAEELGVNWKDYDRTVNSL